MLIVTLPKKRRKKERKKWDLGSERKICGLYPGRALINSRDWIIEYYWICWLLDLASTTGLLMDLLWNCTGTDDHRLIAWPGLFSCPLDRDGLAFIRVGLKNTRLSWPSGWRRNGLRDIHLHDTHHPVPHTRHSTLINIFIENRKCM